MAGRGLGRRTPRTCRAAPEERRSGAKAERPTGTVAGGLGRGRPRPGAGWTLDSPPAVPAQESYWDFVAPRVPRSYGVRDLPHHSIRRNEVFRACAEEELRELAAASDETRFAASAVVIRQGDEGDLFCIVEAGALDVLAAALGADGPAAAPHVGSRSAPCVRPAPPSASWPSCTAHPTRPLSAPGATGRPGQQSLPGHRRRPHAVAGGDCPWRPLGGPDFFGEKAFMSEDVRRATCLAAADPRASPPPTPSARLEARQPARPARRTAAPPVHHIATSPPR